MFDGEVFADFVVLWLTCHQSRFDADIPEKCLLEAWAHEAVERGTRALDQLRVGVEEAIASLGEGFLAHPANTVLRNSLEDGVLDKQEYYRELLRLVYRLLFLLVTESRDLLLMPDADETVRARYRDHYGVERLRNTADQVRGGPHGDQWQSLQLVFEALGRVDGEPALGLPGLGGFLWERRATPHIGECHLANEHLFRALRALSTVQDGKVRRRVDYGDLDSQELGSVYESLLELHPVLDVHVRSFSLSTAGGNERKTTGAFYTPDELVEELLDSALDPVLDEAEAADDPVQALLDVTVLDPACGSGHFLIAAGRRIATRLARVRAEVGEPSPAELTRALRDVVGRCLHGIDIQEMAVELCKVSLWMAAAEPGKPLSFLEHRIVCGNGLLGATPRLIAEGIPDEAFKPLAGDDKEVVKAWKSINKKERLHPDQLQMSFTSPEEDLAKLAQLTERLDALPDDDLLDLERKQQAWSLIQHGGEMARAKFAADTWCAAFVAPKVRGAPVITSRVVAEAERRQPSELDPTIAGAVVELTKEYQFLHLHLAFPGVLGGSLAAGSGAGGGVDSLGFSAVVGNPPWEHTELKEQEWFAERSPEIAAANGAQRKALINDLAQVDPALHAEFSRALRRADGERLILSAGGRFPLCGRGRINTYAVFAEMMRTSLGHNGRLGVIVPSGIAMDDTTKHFFNDLMASGSLIKLVDFENRKKLFSGVHSGARFCLLTIGRKGSADGGAEFGFLAQSVGDLSDPGRVFNLSFEDILLLNPLAGTCPVFRSKRELEIARQLHSGAEILGRPSSGAWVSRVKSVLNSAESSSLFTRSSDLSVQGALPGPPYRSDENGKQYLRVYEAKMIDIFDHRSADVGLGKGTVRDAIALPISEDGHKDPCLIAQPRYWISRDTYQSVFLDGWGRDWFLVWRDVTSATNSRTLVPAVIPACGFSRNNLPPLFLEGDTAEVCFVYAMLSSYVVDCAARWKTGGLHLAIITLQQLPLVPRAVLRQDFAGNPIRDFVAERVAELVYSAWDMQSFAIDLGILHPPFVWNQGRRDILRAELDALFFHLYGIRREDLDYIMETFPIVKRKDKAEFGEYRTKRLILEIYDEMAEAERNGTEYQTRLDPPPADPSLCHPESTRPDWAKPVS